MTQPLTRESVQTALDRIVAEVGEDFRYSDFADPTECHYAWNDQPGCLFGRVLYRHGYTVADLYEWEGVTPHQILAELGNEDHALDAAAMELQSDQDQDHAWGYCRTMFTANLRDIAAEVNE